MNDAGDGRGLARRAAEAWAVAAANEVWTRPMRSNLFHASTSCRISRRRRERMEWIKSMEAGLAKPIIQATARPNPDGCEKRERGRNAGFAGVRQYVIMTISLALLDHGNLSEAPVWRLPRARSERAAGSIESGA